MKMGLPKPLAAGAAETCGESATLTGGKANVKFPVAEVSAKGDPSRVVFHSASMTTMGYQRTPNRLPTFPTPGLTRTERP